LITHDSDSASWSKLLVEIETMREHLHCSEGTAWFRGHIDESWQLTPTLYRYGGREDYDDISTIDSIRREEQKYKDEWKKHLSSKKKLKAANRAHSEANSSSSAAEETRKEYHIAVAKAKKAKAKAMDARKRHLRFCAPVGGERDIFDEYCFRSGVNPTTSSWEILAEMRHHGIPTRLMDWTDRVEVALYFATLNSLSNKRSSCLWILNPYRLSKKITGRTSIIDIKREGLDYYELLLNQHNWPYDAPIPIYPPSSIPRVRAQSGFFTVHGNSKDPLEEQVPPNKETYLGKIILSEGASKFFLDKICRISGLNEFSIYRDLDSLGKMLRDKFIKMQLWNPMKERDFQ
jgi:hypothetical protein